MKVSELSGSMLDYWVAKIEGVKDVMLFVNCEFVRGTPLGTVSTAPRYSMDWAIGGPIIDRAEIDIEHYALEVAPSAWECAATIMSGGFRQYGPTPLIAAMRSYVASKYGNEVPEPSYNTEAAR